MKLKDLRNVVREEILAAMSEDLISSNNKNDIITKIVNGLETNEGIKKVIKTKSASDGSITWVLGTDDNVYEITVRHKLNYVKKDSEIFNDQK